MGGGTAGGWKQGGAHNNTFKKRHDGKRETSILVCRGYVVFDGCNEKVVVRSVDTSVVVVGGCPCAL